MYVFNYGRFSELGAVHKVCHAPGERSNCNLIERSLQISEMHIATGQSLGFSI